MTVAWKIKNKHYTLLVHETDRRSLKSVLVIRLRKEFTDHVIWKTNFHAFTIVEEKFGRCLQLYDSTSIRLGFDRATIIRRCTLRL